MEVANVRLRLNKVGSDVPLKDVTPAEAMFQHIIHGPQNGGMTFGEEFEKINIIGTAKVDTGETKKVIDVKAVEAKPAMGDKPAVVGVEEVSHQEPVLRDRTDAEELKRLGAKYNGARTKDNKPIIDTVWPDKFNPKLPQKFSDLKWQEIGSTAVGIDLAPLNYATGGLAKTTL